MTKKTIKYAGIFTAFFIAALLALFPYSSVADSALMKLITENKLPVSYTKVKSGLFRTNITGVTLNNITIGDQIIDKINLGNIKLSYTPFSLLTHSVKAFINSDYGTANIKYSKNNVIADTALNISRLAGTLKFQAAGELKITIKYNSKDLKGVLNLNSSSFTLSLPVLGPVKGDSLTAECTITGNILMITSLKIAGDNLTVENADGQIELNRENIKRSTLNITGKARVMGLTSDFGIRGAINSPQFSTQIQGME
ncbi:MAG: type II secretion system protein GspN [Deferribacteraceae bacterium]|nr:type II secretion system protein GspN [Deferribacteraceae bacterium]